MDEAQKMQDLSNDNPEDVQRTSESTESKEEISQPEALDASASEASEEGVGEQVITETTEAIEAEEEKEVKAEESVEEPSEEKESDNKPESLEATVPEEKQEVEGSETVEVHTEATETPKEETPEEVIPDLSGANKAEVLSALQEVKNEEDGRKLDKILKPVKARFDELYELSKNEALQSYVSEGNEADGFQYHGDDTDKSFFALHNVLRARRNKFFKDLESSKEDNLKKKERLLDQLREVVDGDETEASFHSVRDIQAEWKNVGPVPGAQNRTLWANYNALLDRFYDNRSIYFELKDLDRKKNLSLKEELCEKAEALAQHEDLKVAIVQLNDLHDEYKHVGPVPKEDQEPLWQRFKAASDAIYSKRKVFFDDLKVQFEKNLVLKDELIKELESFLSFESDRISEWNKKTKEILQVQKRWEAIGGVPKDKAKAVNKAFWHTFKSFFAHKNKFFKSLESQRDDNLLKKQELIEKANELKESEDFVSTADKLKHLQSQWKEIGPVPEKVRNEIYQQFKAACDHFFERRRSQNQQQNVAYEENLTLKLQVCDQIDQLADTAGYDLDEVYDLVDNYSSIGFVPKNAIKKVQRRFDDVIGKILGDESVSEYDRADLKTYIQTSRMRNSPGGEGKIKRRENSLKRRISSLENDINTYKTNMEFFAKSKTADKMKAEFDEKIAKAQDELDDLKSQLRALYQ